MLLMSNEQWCSQGLQSGGGGQVERQRREHCREGLGACSPGKILKFRASETPFRAFWGEILQNSDDYNIIIRSRMPASSVIRLRIISWT